MKTSFVSNLAVQNAMRSTIAQGQLELIKLQQEVTTGKYADAGAALGASTSRAVSLKAELERLSNLKDTNAIVTQRLSASQSALENMRTAADQVNTALIAVLGSEDVMNLNNAKTEISGALSTFVSAVNVQFGGEFLMAGINTDVKPLATYDENSAAKATFDAEVAKFGKPLSDFTVDDMKELIDNVEKLYTEGDTWNKDWSQASDQNIVSRISANETVASTTNANTMGVRKFALATVLTTELLGADVSADVRKTVNSAAQNYIQQASSSLIETSSVLGISEERLKKATTSIEAQTKLVKTHITDIEGIDVYEASTRMNALLTQLETSYTLTSRLQQMSLINYL